MMAHWDTIINRALTLCSSDIILLLEKYSFCEENIFYIKYSFHMSLEIFLLNEINIHFKQDK